MPLHYLLMDHSSKVTKPNDLKVITMMADASIWQTSSTVDRGYCLRAHLLMKDMAVETPRSVHES
jgi:hypothetical protein